MMRDKHVDRGGIWGLLIFLGYIIAIGILVTNVVTAVNKYGSIVQNPNKEDRDAVVSFLETKMNSGDQTFGRKLENNISSLDFQVERNGSTTVIVVSGLGRYELGNDEITQYINNQVRTRLIFQKEGASNYQIVGVVTGERAIDGSNAEVFWNMYMH